MFFEAGFDVPYYGLNSQERVKPGLLLQFLQEAAALHANTLKIGVSDLRAQGATWVLRRYRICMKKCRRPGNLTVKTWFEPVKNLMSVRVFEIRGVSGDLVADAWSSWIAVDLKKNRPSRLNRILPQSYYAAAEDTGDAPEAHVPDIDGACDSEETFMVRRGELDLNGHANHTAYFDWAVETVPDEIWAEAQPVLLDAEYLASVGRENVVVRTQKIQCDLPDKHKFVHSIVPEATGALAARIATVWERYR